MNLTAAEREFLNSLALYLATKRTALRSALQLRAPLSTEQADDLRIHYSNYFVNLLSLIELIRESKTLDGPAFVVELNAQFTVGNSTCGAQNYLYVRELRNAIVHRGLNIFSAAQFPKGFPLLIAPKSISNKDGNKKYTAFSPYIIGIIDKCESVVGPTIEAHLNKLGLLEKIPDQEELTAECLELVENLVMIPGWVKKMFRENQPAVDFHVIHRSSIAKLKELLQPNVAAPDA